MRTNRKILRTWAWAAAVAGALAAWAGLALPSPVEVFGDVPLVPPLSGRRIFVPTPKGAGETLDDSPGAGPPAQTDVVTTVLGDRLLGNVLGIAVGDKLRLAGPQFEGEVQVDIAALDAVVLRSADKESGSDEVVLTNGDRIIGQLSAITPEGVFVETQAAGQIKISPKVVRAISFSKGASVLVESNFAAGSFEPWTTRSGSWTVSEGVLLCRHRGSSGSNQLSVKLDQREAVTLVAKVRSLEGTSVRCDLIVFADTTDGGPNEGRYGRNSIFAMFQSSECYLHAVSNNSTNMITNRNFGRNLQEGTLRLAYDPAAGKAFLWLDTMDLGQYDVPNRPAAGQFVMFNSYYPLKVEHLAVYRGVVPPSGDDEGPARPGGAADETVIQFTNKDRVSATSVALADGQVTFTTAYGQLQCPVATVHRILFGKQGQEQPRRQNNDVRVQTAAGRLTFQFDRLTADSLLGKSECLGEVSLRRGAVREIRFNLYR